MTAGSLLFIFPLFLTMAQNPTIPNILHYFLVSAVAIPRCPGAQIDFAAHFALGQWDHTRTDLSLGDRTHIRKLTQFEDFNPTVRVHQDLKRAADFAAVVFSTAPGEPGFHMTVGITGPPKHRLSLFNPQCGTAFLTSGIRVSQ